jgi:riboflavin synthase
VFTGIVEELGQVVARQPRGAGAVLTVRGPLVTSDARGGDSIAVNGVCVTVVDLGQHTFTVEVMKETLDRSTLGGLSAGDPVNLERAVTAATRLGGHLVQGHVDGVGTVLARTPGDLWEGMRVGLPGGLSRYVVEKGSIAVDGVSLTVVSVTAGWFEVGLIPATLALTTLGRSGVGTPVNLEVDVIAKYVERLMAGVRP